MSIPTIFLPTIPLSTISGETMTMAEVVVFASSKAESSTNDADESLVSPFFWCSFGPRQHATASLVPEVVRLAIMVSCDLPTR